VGPQYTTTERSAKLTRTARAVIMDAECAAAGRVGEPCSERRQDSDSTFWAASETE